ncbi:6354_t:CDS:2 [Gigaspora margarita]|uniref:6354_t:CDS:1 n=1 Tax=Gigaspora margarita TaxID=4874 RepID=A0ABN7W256_GIGMA|nr:6354_t:CDS:2 [Gigaspora margarita]
MCLEHYEHVLSPETIHFANVYQQLPQKLLSNEFKEQLFLDKDLVLKNLLLATNNLQPTTTYSDCDTGLGPAIESTLSTMRYLHCIFHIEFNASMFLTQRVESINAIIYKYVNSHLTLRECFNGIQSMLSSELQKAKYRDYLKNLPFTIGSSLPIRIFLDIIKLLKSSLMDEIFRIQKAQIDICFEYFFRLIPSN